MSNISFGSPSLFIDDAQDMQDRITRICLIQDALLDAATKAALGEDVSEYWLNDGQTQIKSVSRSVAEITKSYNDLEVLRQMYLNRLNGHSVVLKDGISNNPNY